MGIGRGNHPNSRKNLKKFVPGVAPNPNGSSEKQRARMDDKARIEELKKKYGIEGREPFTTESRRRYFEFMRSLTPSEFAKAATDAELPIGAVIDVKNLHTDFVDGTSSNTDRVERQIYGNKGNVNISGSVDGGVSMSTIGFVFGGKEIEDDGE